MKYLYFFSLILCTFLSNAQIPQGIPYQAIARNASGNVLVNQNIAVRFTVFTGSSSGTIAYAERHTTSTNALGLFTLTLGAGTPLTNTFASINWAVGSKFLQVEIDPTGGSSYVNGCSEGSL